MNVIEVLRGKERIAKWVAAAGVVAIYAGLIGLLLGTYVLPSRGMGATVMASGALAVLGILAEVIGDSFATTYRWERESIGNGMSTEWNCSECKGSGTSWDESTGGKCWDCRGTGLINGGEL